MNLFNALLLDKTVVREPFLNELLQVNEEIKEYGLALTKEDVKQMIRTRDRVLRNYGRVELSFEVIKKLIQAFSSSAFINDKNYISTLNELQETFYYLKNETEDELGDDILLEKMKELFENTCEGSIELLNSSLETFSRKFRNESL